MQVRQYESEDLAAVQRIWQECGWVDEDEAEHLEDFLADAHTVVADIDGDAEACTSIHDGTLDHTGSALPAAVVSSVTTGRVGRRQGLARATLAQALTEAAGRGAAVSVLGMFEQGFYDTVGFGTGTEMLLLRVDPAHLRVPPPTRAPQRLDMDDIDDVVAALVARTTAHGAVTLPSVAMRRAERAWDEGGFGLGFRDDDGTLTHFLWCSVKDEHGPYEVRDWAWRDNEQLLELLGVVASLGDQVRTVVVPEPAQLQLQPLVDRPGRMKVVRTQGEHRFELRASAWWQARILDLEACVAALEAVDDLACNLRVHDPLDLPGVTGDWVLRLGRRSSVTPGHEDGLPLLTCTVNALSRMWLGVRPPSVVAATDGIVAPSDLLAALDAAVRLPRPDVSMDF